MNLHCFMKIAQKCHDLWKDAGFVLIIIIITNVEKIVDVEKMTQNRERSLGM